MVKIVINEGPFEVEEGTTVLKAAELAGISIPHFCYHPAFAPEGSCRMCLVEIQGLPKLELACSTQVRDGMTVFTRSESVIEARKGVLEFLLAEHPIDCPICDKAGECKLQNYYEDHGLFDSQFQEEKERREKKVTIGKRLILDRERCILCTRCVRFLKEVTGTRELGLFHRGIHSEIHTLDGALVDNNYSGNLAQICPVGAITDLDFRFKTRTWFLRNGESICPLCSRGCSITVEYHRGFPRFPLPQRVFRVKARRNPSVNGHWICDVGRYGYSDLNENRAERIVMNSGGRSHDWENAVGFLTEKVKNLFYKRKTSHMAVLLTSWLSNEELYLIRKIFRDDLGCERFHFADPPDNNGDGFLLTEDRSPNKRGAQEIGFQAVPLKADALSGKTELLIVFEPFLAHRTNFGELKSVLGKIGLKVLLTSHSSKLDAEMDAVFPVTAIAERGGSLTNRDGIVQTFVPAMSPLGDSRPTWQVLVSLGKSLGINFNFYKGFSSPESIRQEMGKEISFFGKKSG